MGITREQKVIRDLSGKPTIQKFTPIADGLFLPNHSGIASHPEMKKIISNIDLSGYVPYTDATQDVDLGEWGISGDLWSISGTDGEASFGNSLQLIGRFNEQYGANYGPSFDFDARQVDGADWRMLSTGSDDSVGAGWFEIVADPNYANPEFAISPSGNTILKGDAGAEYGSYRLQAYSNDGSGGIIHQSSTGNYVYMNANYGGESVAANLEVGTMGADEISYITMRTDGGDNYSVFGMTGETSGQAFFVTSASNGLYFDAYYGDTEFKNQYGGNIYFADGVGGYNNGRCIMGKHTDDGVNKLQVVGGLRSDAYKSSDGSAGITTTITTASLVGKTITIKNGLITGFA